MDNEVRICSNCIFWDKEGDALESGSEHELNRYEHHHQCELAKHSVRGDDGKPTNLDAKMVLRDGEDYEAILYTHPNHGCIGWKSRE